MRFRKVKLPRQTRKHPLLIGLAKVMAEEECSMRSIAKRHFKISQQALFQWVLGATEDRNFNVPPRQVPVICRLTGQAPYLYNPELWPNPEWRV